MQLAREQKHQPSPFPLPQAWAKISTTCKSLDPKGYKLVISTASPRQTNSTYIGQWD